MEDILKLRNVKVADVVLVTAGEELVPVIVTVKVPALFDEHERAAVAGEGGRVTLAGEMD